MNLENIQCPGEIRDLSLSDCNKLAKKIRDFLIENLSKTGGHLASNLGTVELTIALFKSFNLEEDKVVWDVGHQTYTHKILSGRADRFSGLRKYGGLSGFPKTKESKYDAFNTGHSSTSISAGIGLCQAGSIKKEDYFVVSVIGDGALTGGMAYEALNNAAQLKKNFIIVLNDNEMSISPNVGGISKYLSNIRTDRGYNSLKHKVADSLSKIPVIGQPAVGKIRNTKNGLKQLLIPGMLFENMGLTYLGPVDGHDIKAMYEVFLAAKKLDHAVLVHVITQKGRGYKPAERNPEKFHGVGSFDIVSGESLSSQKVTTYTDVFSKKMLELGKKNPNLVAITAAMPEGTGLVEFAKKFPRRFFDVGIAEQHAVTVAAGMAVGGLKPVVAIYSSFLQRAFDQIIHDVCIEKLNVLFAIDRAGLVGADGETHQGIFDLSYLNLIPNMTILAPKNDAELCDMLDFANDYYGPIAIRYPRGKAYTGLHEFREKIELGKAEMLYEEEDIAILALGSMVSTGEHVREKLKAKGHRVSLVNLRFVKPLDYDMINRVCRNHDRIITMEENVACGSFGLAVNDHIRQHYPGKQILNIHIPDEYVDHGDVSLLRKDLQIDSDSILERWNRMQNNPGEDETFFAG